MLTVLRRQYALNIWLKMKVIGRKWAKMGLNIFIRIGLNNEFPNVGIIDTLNNLLKSLKQCVRYEPI